jgi:hypothetical protein
MTERGLGFSLTDHRRVSKVVRRGENGDFDPPKLPSLKPSPRGLVRVMLIDRLGEDLNSGIPDPIQGDFLMDGVSLAAAITQPTSVEYDGHVHYVVRCVSSDQSVTVRTWQLRVVPPARGPGTLTAPIDEHATGAQVAAAINATGCPPCVVIGSEYMLLDQDAGQVAWPDRQWHIIWPDNSWYLSTQRYVDTGLPEQALEYDVGGAEVPIALIPTAYAPTPFCEDVYLPFSMTFAVPTPGTFALCQVLPGLGLVIVKPECWTYVD